MQHQQLQIVDTAVYVTNLAGSALAQACQVGTKSKSKVERRGCTARSGPVNVLHTFTRTPVGNCIIEEIVVTLVYTSTTVAGTSDTCICTVSLVSKIMTGDPRGRSLLKTCQLDPCCQL
jgi:hypothetical protein